MICEYLSHHPAFRLLLVRLTCGMFSGILSRKSAKYRRRTTEVLVEIMRKVLSQEEKECHWSSSTSLVWKAKDLLIHWIRLMTLERRCHMKLTTTSATQHEEQTRCCLLCEAPRRRGCLMVRRGDRYLCQNQGQAKKPTYHHGPNGKPSRTVEWV